MKYQEEYNKWISDITNEVNLKELKNLSEEEKKTIFSNTLEFGTGGLRAIMGQGPSLLNEYTVRRVTNGFAQYIIDKYDEGSTVIIAHDCRNNAQFFSNVASAALLEKGIKVYQFSELVPTPLLSYMVRKLKAEAGIMITASHNPKEYNGYKVYDPSGAQLNLDDANEVIKYINNTDFDFSEYDEKQIAEQKIIEQNLIDEYLDLIKTNPEGKDLKVVFTPNHGTSYKLAPEILKLSGYNNVLCVKEQMTPDGDFTNTKSANPEEVEYFELANKYLLDNNYDIAVGTDPDADRIGLVVNEEGNLRAYTGNETGSLLIKYLIDTKAYNEKSIIYKTIVTGEMGALLAKKAGIKVEETLTGFKFIGEKIKNEDNYEFLFGYEESYGYLFNDIVRDKDAIQSVVQIADMINYYNKQGKKLSEVLEELYTEVGKHCEITYSYKVSDLDIIKRVMNKYRNYNESTIFGYEVTEKIDYLNDETGLPKSDVLKFFLKDYGWLVFRPSGTEPKIKMYVSISSEDADVRVPEVEKQFSTILKEI